MLKFTTWTKYSHPHCSNKILAKNKNYDMEMSHARTASFLSEAKIANYKQGQA